VIEQKIQDFPGLGEEKQKDSRESAENPRILQITTVSPRPRSTFSLPVDQFSEGYGQSQNILKNRWMNSQQKMFRDLKSETTPLDNCILIRSH
jgi:hypothetical protein